MAGNIVGTPEAEAVIQAIKAENWADAQARLAEAFLKLDNYFTQFTYVPVFTQGGSSTTGPSSFSLLSVQGMRVGSWVFINGEAIPSVTLGAGAALIVNLPPELPASTASLSAVSLGTLTWFVAGSAVSRFGQAVLDSSGGFVVWADNAPAPMGVSSPAGTLAPGDILRFSIQYQTTAAPF